MLKTVLTDISSNPANRSLCRSLRFSRDDADDVEDDVGDELDHLEEHDDADAQVQTQGATHVRDQVRHLVGGQIIRAWKINRALASFDNYLKCFNPRFTITVAFILAHNTRTSLFLVEELVEQQHEVVLGMP